MRFALAGSQALPKVWSSAGVTLQTPQSFRKNALGCGGTPIADTVILGDVRTKFCVYRNPPAVTSVFIGEPTAYLAEITFSDSTTTVLVRSPDKGLAVRIIDTVRRP